MLKDFPKHLEATLHDKPNSINYYALLGDSVRPVTIAYGQVNVHSPVEGITK